MNSTRRNRLTFLMALPCLLALQFAAANDLESISNRLAISEALAAYSYRWDAKDSQGFAELFTDDAVMQRRALDESKLSFQISGRQAVFEYAQDSHRNRLADRQTRHHMSALVFLELTNATAVTENMALITHQTGISGAPFIASSGIYTIHWRNTEQGWRIASRLLVSDRFAASQ